MNPDIKISQLRSMDEKLRQRFSWYGAYKPTAPSYAIEPFGHRFVPALFGCDIIYEDSTAPWAEHRILTPEHIDAMPLLTLDEFKQDERVREVARQIHYSRKKYGWCSAQQNLGSVMNTAIYLRGMELFSDFYERPETIHKLMNLITNRMILAYEYGKEMDGKASDTGVGNCSVCMISPQTYDEFIYPYDHAMMELAQKNTVHFGVHHDSNATSYLESYRKFEHLHHLDIGFDTDIPMYREAFPLQNLNIYFYTNFIIEHTPQEIKETVSSLAASSGSSAATWFTCADIDARISDEKITALYEAIH
jgi:uroporphyrinogen-III decarboxylase